MPREFSRSQRVAAQMQRELALIIQSEIRDPRLGLITINEVELSRDLAVAKVYFTVLGKARDQIKKDHDILNRSIPFIRRELGKRMRIRLLPELRFIYDESLDKGMRIDRLIHDMDPDSGASQEGSE
jgi:ribosome-binding factor A